MHGQFSRRLGLIARHAGLGQLTFSLAQFELRIEPRGDAAACDVHDILALRGGSLGDLGQRVLTIKLQRK